MKHIQQKETPMKQETRKEATQNKEKLTQDNDQRSTNLGSQRRC